MQKFFKYILAACLLLLSLPVKAAIADGKTKYFGNIAGHDKPVPASWDTYWNQMTPENSGKWGFVEATRDVMYWDSLDTIYNYAKSKGIPFKQHNFIWGIQQPSWITDLSAAEQAAEVEEWIMLFAERYPGTDWIDVVNEPFNQPPPYKDAIGGDGATGWDWVIWSFEKARHYFPNAKLLLNENSIFEGWVTVQEYADLANLLYSRGLLDGVGIESYLDCKDDPAYDPAQVKKKLDDLSALISVPIHMSEFAVDCANDATQKQRYEEVISVYWEHPNVAGVTGWGYLEGQVWKKYQFILYSDEITKRPALDWLIDYVTGGGSSSGPAAPSNLSATAKSSSQIDLAWTDNSTDEDKFEIERSTDNASFAKIAEVGANVTTYSDTGLTKNTTYYYRIRACNSTGCSAYSNTASAKTNTR